ncbi:putative alpha-amylase [Talaromyces proteolyticus]|uniref:Alpha-amylase n=1 Tax=Talaromyces proteolyticus TaxID=1131652 RepID=A0AAD4PUP7_9EURO|nr:putative alpha-amylase [Talaromyces proteolyticus]KAH8689610.1 putative alpha-amylase [Talaromyces proteolyticus]
MAAQHTERQPWKEAVVYQIYPASFADTNGDGWGDLPGIISKIDYIKSVGADVIWLSPIYASPQNDMGYDVSDYRSIHAPYGTLADVDRLISELRARGMKLWMDLVVNHTSDEHKWFKESRRSKDNPKRDWYFWRDPKYDAQGVMKPPNNWKGIFGGSAWTYDEPTGQYYLSLFLPTQPDLNWTNSELRQAVHDDIRFWLDRGVDGFRIDSMNLMSKHPDLPDGEITSPDEEYQSGAKWFASGPRMHEYLRELRTKVFDAYNAVTVGELGFTKDVESVSKYVAKSRQEINMLFTGDIIDMDFGVTGKYVPGGGFHPRHIRTLTEKWQTAMPQFDGWNTLYLDNHDSGRSVTRYGSDDPRYRIYAAKLLSTYLTTLSGTLFLLAGQEIGMANMPRDMGIEHYIDVEGRNYYMQVLQSRGGDHGKMGDVMQELQLKARDHGRLPMQWTAGPNAGFTDPETRPWMTVNPDHKMGWNVGAQRDDPNSVLSFWKQSLVLRKKFADIFIYGAFEIIPESASHERVLAYRRKDYSTDKEALVLLNFSDQDSTITAPWIIGWTFLRGNYSTPPVHGETVVLRPYEAVVYSSGFTL